MIGVDRKKWKFEDLIFNSYKDMSIGTHVHYAVNSV